MVGASPSSLSHARVPRIAQQRKSRRMGSPLRKKRDPATLAQAASRQTGDADFYRQLPVVNWTRCRGEGGREPGDDVFAREADEVLAADREPDGLRQMARISEEHVRQEAPIFSPVVADHALPPDRPEGATRGVREVR